MITNGDDGSGGSCFYFGGHTAQTGRLGLVGGHPALSLHSSNEPGELTQWLVSGHDDSTINIVVVIIMMIIIIIIITGASLSVAGPAHCAVLSEAFTAVRGVRIVTKWSAGGEAVSPGLRSGCEVGVVPQLWDLVTIPVDVHRSDAVVDELRRRHSFRPETRRSATQSQRWQWVGGSRDPLTHDQVNKIPRTG